MSVEIHETAIVNPKAELGKDVIIGPYSIVGPNVKIGDGSEIKSHVVVNGHTSIGAGNKIFQFSSIGEEPQDLSYKGEATETIIGDNNIFREYASVHRGTLKQEGKTIIGNDNLFMSYVHFGHDVTIGSNIIIANSTNCAGHVKIGDRVIIGGSTGISQFVSLGRASYVGGGTAVDKDVPSYCTALGNRVRLKGINIIGLKRMGNSKPVVSEVIDFYRTMEASTLSPIAFVSHPELMVDFKDNEIVKEISEFIRQSEMGIAPFMS